MEVLVAISVLAVTMAATASSVIRSLEVARDSRESVIAANVVQYELERLRAIPFVDWVQTATTTPSTSGTFSGPDGQRYEVTREARWIQAGAADSGCDGAQAGADYVRVSQTVVFPGRDIDPVSNVTIITPRLAFFDPYTGNLAVTVRDRDGVGAPGHQVRVQGFGGTEIATTDADGCAFFVYLPVSAVPGTTSSYTITIATPGHADPTGSATITGQAVVAIQSTTIREYRYDEAATVVPTHTTPSPGGGCTVSVRGQLTAVLPATGGDATTRPTGQTPLRFPLLSCATGGPAGWVARAPLNLGHRLIAADSTFGNRAFDPADTVVRPTGITPLFPFASGYGVHAGRCTGSDPLATGAPSRPQAVSGPGQTNTVTVPLAVATVRTVTGTSLTGTTNAPDVEVFADTRDTATCPAGERLYLGRSGLTGTIRVALPHGRWVLHWTPVGTPPRAARWACSELVAAACTTLRADATPIALTGLNVTAIRR